MSSIAHLFCFNIALKEVKCEKMLLRVPELVMVGIVQDAGRKNCRKTVRLKIKNSNIIVKIVVNDLSKTTLIWLISLM